MHIFPGAVLLQPSTAVYSLLCARGWILCPSVIDGRKGKKVKVILGLCICKSLSKQYMSSTQSKDCHWKFSDAEDRCMQIVYLLDHRN